MIEIVIVVAAADKKQREKIKAADGGKMPGDGFDKGVIIDCSQAAQHKDEQIVQRQVVEPVVKQVLQDNRQLAGVDTGAAGPVVESYLQDKQQGKA